MTEKEKLIFEHLPRDGKKPGDPDTLRILPEHENLGQKIRREVIMKIKRGHL